MIKLKFVIDGNVPSTNSHYNKTNVYYMTIWPMVLYTHFNTTVKKISIDFLKLNRVYFKRLSKYNFISNGYNEIKTSILANNPELRNMYED